MRARKHTRTSFGEFRIHTVRETPSFTTLKPEDTLRYWHEVITPSPQMHLPDKEHLIVLMLNIRNRITGWHLVSMGSLNECLSYPREVMRPVLLASAFSFILIHNHPSGDPTPSDADRRFTSRLRECGALFGIHLIDHLIIGSEDVPPCLPFFSFRLHGLL